MTTYTICPKHNIVETKVVTVSYRDIVTYERVVCVHCGLPVTKKG